jgi:putative oxygen-independent coproporphyrinogen III oxidase
MNKAGLYLHIPFCLKKCGYCDFYSITRLQQQNDFTEALVQEMGLLSPQYKHLEFDTIYLGGGTPSLLSTKQLEYIWLNIQNYFTVSPQGEFSIEANPGTIDQERLSALRQAGFNRLSLGVQSFYESDLNFLGRIHSVREIYEGFESARQAGFENINVDLISAFPGLTGERFQSTLQKAAELRPEHISCYTLIFEPNTPFYRRLKLGELQSLSADEEAGFIEISNQELLKRGYTTYEISNYAISVDYFCQHNLKYWEHQPYLGLGPSAHSFISPRRWKNHRSVTKYIHSLKNDLLPIAQQETLNTDDLEFEYIFLHLRLREGLNLVDFQDRFRADFIEKYRIPLEKLDEAGLIDLHDRQLRLSDRGWLLADEVSSFF